VLDKFHEVSTAKAEGCDALTDRRLDALAKARFDALPAIDRGFELNRRRTRTQVEV
jgi:hypothetical protein